MAGTDSKRPDSGAANGPTVILVEPQLGENIGMVARAMLNCGLTDLRLVNPRDGWPSEIATATASGADVVISGARLYASSAAAVGDLNFLVAATARPRDMTMRVVTPRQCAAELRRAAAGGNRTGIMFGRESKGLHNDDVALADAVLNVPLNPAFSSLNLAQAVLLVGFEWFQAADATADDVLNIPKDTRPATKKELIGMFEQLEAELDDCGFFHVREKRPIMARNIRNVFQRAAMTEQEIRTFRGVIAGLGRKRKPLNS